MTRILSRPWREWCRVENKFTRLVSADGQPDYYFLALHQEGTSGCLVGLFGDIWDRSQAGDYGLKVTLRDLLVDPQYGLEDRLFMWDAGRNRPFCVAFRVEHLQAVEAYCRRTRRGEVIDAGAITFFEEAAEEGADPGFPSMEEYLYTHLVKRIYEFEESGRKSTDPSPDVRTLPEFQQRQCLVEDKVPLPRVPEGVDWDEELKRLLGQK